MDTNKSKKEETGIKVSSHLKITILDEDKVILDQQLTDRKIDGRKTKYKI